MRFVDTNIFLRFLVNDDPEKADACEMLYSYTKADRLDLVEPNRFQAVVDADACVGCQDCVEKCPFNAIEMLKTANSRKLKKPTSAINKRHPPPIYHLTYVSNFNTSPQHYLTYGQPCPIATRRSCCAV